MSRIVDTLLKYLQHHFDDKSSPDLCAELTACTQMRNETALDFVLRCIELREKLVLSSKTTGEIEYDESLVKRLFVRTLERGIENTNILNELRPLLKSEYTTDEELLEATQVVANSERERKSNFARKSLKINQVDHPSHKAYQTESTNLKDNQPSTKVLTDLTASLTEITKQLTALTREVNVLKGEKSSNRIGCESCQIAGRRRNHCYVCGKLGHRGRQCRERKSGEANKSQIRGTL